MVRLFLSVFFALFILAVPKKSVGQTGQLAGLTEIKLLVKNLSRAAKQSGLTERQMIESQLNVFEHMATYIENRRENFLRIVPKPGG